MIALTGTYLTTGLPAKPWEIVAMIKKASKIDWQEIFGSSFDRPKGQDYNMNRLCLPVSPAVKVPKEIFDKINTIAKASYMEPWEVIQELIAYRFKESA